MDHKSQLSEADPLLQGPKNHEHSKSNGSSSLKWKIWLNLVILSMSNAFTITSINALAGAQTSLNYKDGLGSTSLALSMIGGVIGSFFFNSVLKKIGSKLCFMLGIACNIVLTLVNLYPTWYTILPSALLAGFFGIFISITTKANTAQIAHLYCKLQNQQNQYKIQARMFMVNILLYKGIVAAFLPVTSIMLGANDEQPAEANEQMSIANGSVSHCGSAYCNEGFEQVINATLTDTNSTDFTSVLKFVMLLTGVHVVAAIILLFVKFPKLNDDFHEKSKTFPISIMATPRMIMLMPTLMILNGADTFWTMDFTSAFITCSLGIEYIGLVTMWTGVTGALSCLVFGSFNSEKFRKVPLVFSALIQLAILVFLLVWPMKSNVFLMLCVMTAGWYIGSGIRMTLLPALIAVVFPEDLESSFSVMHFWGYFGSFFVTLWSGWLCTSIKIIILLTIIAVSLIGYIGLEISIIRKNRQLNTILK